MGWSTTADAAAFLRAAGPFLSADRLGHDPLLTEADFWSWLRPRPDGGLFGWWAHEDEVVAAFVFLPEHPVLCSRMTSPQAAALVGLELGTDTWGIDVRDSQAIVQGHQEIGRNVRPLARRQLLRLTRPSTPRSAPAGRARPAGSEDAELLRTWFDDFATRHPEDRSDVAFVIERPLAVGGITIWEVDGRPAAMASRTPLLAGAVRMGLAYQPGGPGGYATAAFDAACAEAARVGEVLAMSGTPANTRELESLGFELCRERAVVKVSGS